MNGNWSQQDMTSTSAPPRTQASLALTAFWAMVTVGRILFAAIVRWMPARIVFHVLPIVLVGTFTLTAALPDDTPWLGVAVFGLAGLGCSALLPLTISLGQHGLVTMSAAVAGGVIAFYQVGYGIAAFGVGPLVDRGVSLAIALRLDCGRRRRHGFAVLRGRRTPSLSAGVASTACGPRTASRFGRLGP